MLARKQRRKRQPQRTAASSATGEDRRSVTVTVAWMLATLATLFATLGALGVLVGIRWLSADQPPGRLAVLPGLLLLTGCVTAAVVVALTPLVYRFRPAPPPAIITWGALAIAAGPWLTWGLWAALSD